MLILEKGLTSPTGNEPLLFIDLDAVIHNYRLIRRKITAKNDLVMPVVKSDAYGHGLAQVSLALARAGAQAFCVGTVAEALLLRQALNGYPAGAGSAIWALLGAADKEEVHAALAENISLLLYRSDQVSLWAEQVRKARTRGVSAPLRVALKLNSGMNRLGFSPKELLPLLRQMLQGAELCPEMICTHLSSADMPEELEYTRAQAGSFLEACLQARALYPEIKASLCNSAGFLNLEAISPAFPLPLAHRPGLAIYGSNPFHGTELAPLGQELRPAMSLLAPVLDIHDFGPGCSIGYGRAFTTKKDTRVAVVRVGYADAVPRLVSGPDLPAGSGTGGGEVILAGHRTRILGRVCMQMIMVEVPRTPNGSYPVVNPGDWACLLGRSGKEEISSHDLAARAGTISYEIFCGLGRNKKIFLQRGFEDHTLA